MKRQPLVSVIVVCYNASKYIIETLESVKDQKYKNLELIVSDDCSKDGTAEIAQAWMDENYDLFVRSLVLTTDHNTGVSANYNRAVNACQGEWIKNVDGDDLLKPNCIIDNLNYIESHPCVKLLFSNVEIFSGRGEKKHQGLFFDDNTKKFFDYNSKEQYKILLKKNILPSQSCFVYADLLRQHPYNEKYKGLEDAPMWIYLTKSGEKAYYMDVCTTMYRKEESITKSQERYFSSIYFESMQKFFWMEKVDLIRELGLQEAYNENRKFLFLMEFADIFLGNSRSVFKDFVFRVVRKIVYRFASFKL